MLFSIIGGALIGNGAANLLLLSHGNTHTLLGHTGSIVEILVGLGLSAYRFYQIFTAR